MNWNSVDDYEKLPPEDFLCLITYNGYISVGSIRTEYDGWWWEDEQGEQVESVTHWMPLPELPGHIA